MHSTHTCEEAEFFLGTEGLVGLSPLLVGREQLISDVIERGPLVTIVLWTHIPHKFKDHAPRRHDNYAITTSSFLLDYAMRVRLGPAN